MRTITGKVCLPAEVPADSAERVLIEVRDVSLADAPSTVIAECKLDNVDLRPHGQIKFKMRVPDVGANRELSFRVHISLDGSKGVKSGDLLTTAHYPIPSSGTSEPVEIPVVVI